MSDTWLFILALSASTAVAILIFFEREDLLGKIPFFGKARADHDDGITVAKSGLGAVVLTPSGYLRVSEIIDGLSEGFFTLKGVDESGAEHTINLKNDNIIMGVGDTDTQGLLTDSRRAVQWVCNIDFNDKEHPGFAPMTNITKMDKNWTSMSLVEANRNAAVKTSNELLKLVESTSIKTKAAEEFINTSDIIGVANDARFGRRDHKQLIPKQSSSSSEDDVDEGENDDEEDTAT